MAADSRHGAVCVPLFTPCFRICVPVCPDALKEVSMLLELWVGFVRQHAYRNPAWLKTMVTSIFGIVCSWSPGPGHMSHQVQNTRMGRISAQSLLLLFCRNWMNLVLQGFDHYSKNDDMQMSIIARQRLTRKGCMLLGCLYTCACTICAGLLS